MPTYVIEGTNFIVDLEGNCLREKRDRSNSIPFSKMKYEGTHYEFCYDCASKNIHNSLAYHKDLVDIELPQKIELDPVGMARKHGVSVKALSGKSDFDFIVDRKKFHERVTLNKLPVIDVCGHSYIVDLRLLELRLATDAGVRIVLPNQGASMRYGHLIPSEYIFSRMNDFHEVYHPATRKVIDVANADIEQVPKDVVLIAIPGDVKLDPVVVARERGVDLKDFLLKHPFEKKHEAKVTKLSRERLEEIINLNRRPLIFRNIDSDKKKGMSL